MSRDTSVPLYQVSSVVLIVDRRLSQIVVEFNKGSLRRKGRKGIGATVVGNLILQGGNVSRVGAPKSGRMVVRFPR